MVQLTHPGWCQVHPDPGGAVMDGPDRRTYAGHVTAARHWLGRNLLALLRAPVSAQAWRATSHVVLGALIGAVSCTTVLVLGALTVGLAITVVLAVVTLIQLLIFNWTFTSLQRSRFEALLGVSIPAVSHREDPSVFRRMLAEARSPHTWRQLGYHVLAGVLGPAGALAVVGAWSVGLVLIGSLLYAQSLGTPRPLAYGLTLAGLALLLAAPWLARAVAATDVAAARRLLGPSRSEELASRVESLMVSRDDAVDAADAERRRIERDLHDGAQQRLTSLALKLGIARGTLTGPPSPAHATIAQAHDEAKQALVELRELVRGMHPSVLHERGLDAALSGIAARSPVPVRLRVELPERVGRAVEAVAYYVVSEALTNAARHAHASRVDVRVERAGELLRVTISDNGRGGADPDRGTGLRGLAQRVGSVDGTLRVDSPEGGPTIIAAELPCGW
jgi:signal transduction histidine kinase